jgi:apolipoprotein N-acyltransferase
MKSNSIFPNMPQSKLFYAALLLVGSSGYILLSPRSVVPVFAWIAPVSLLFYFQHATIKRRTLWFFIAILASQIISSYDVAPFPLPVLVIVSIISALKILAVYLVNRWASAKSNRFITTLMFPAAFVTKEFTDLAFNGGAWWSIANTQYDFHLLTQISSVTGLVGISFLIYWFASVVVWSFEKYISRERFLKAVAIYAGIFAAVIIFGAQRYYTNDLTNKPAVKIAGFSVPTFNLLESIHQDVSGKSVHIDPKISISSEKYQEINASLVPFIEAGDPNKFPHANKALHQLNDSLFTLSQKAANKGAKIILWSEGNAILFNSMQDSFINRGKDFALKNNVYLLMAMAVFEPGKITPNKMFLENKTVFIGADGNILNVFHKNFPVPFAERSVPGDGKIPAITTPYGTISPSICYDADLPMSMQQLGQNRSDVLLLPSGDWSAIAPYHSYMATFRGIENGCSVVRQVSGGLSLATDYRGKVQTSFDFYNPGEKFWISDIAIGHVPTIYSRIGDLFAYLCIAITLFSISYAIAKRITKKRATAVAMKYAHQPV